MRDGWGRSVEPVDRSSSAIGSYPAAFASWGRRCGAGLGQWPSLTAAEADRAEHAGAYCAQPYCDRRVVGLDENGFAYTLIRNGAARGRFYGKLTLGRRVLSRDGRHVHVA